MRNWLWQVCFFFAVLPLLMLAGSVLYLHQTNAQPRQDFPTSYRLLGLRQPPLRVDMGPVVPPDPCSDMSATMIDEWEPEKYSFVSVCPVRISPGRYIYVIKHRVLKSQEVTRKLLDPSNVDDLAQIVLWRQRVADAERQGKVSTSL